MKWTKVALVLAIPAVALLLLGQSARPPAAEAKPTTIITINWTLCLTLGNALDWTGDGIVNNEDTTASYFACSGNLGSQPVFDNMIGAIRGIPDLADDPRIDEVLDSPPQPEDFTAPGKDLQGNPLTPMDSDGGQLHQEDGAMWVIAFVSNDDPIGFYAEKGTLTVGGADVGSSVACGPGGAPGNPDYYFVDADCDQDPNTVGDGVVVVLLHGSDADRGAATLRVRQGHILLEDQYTVVGEPYKIEMTASKSAIQTGAPVCNLFSDTPSFLATLGAPEKSPLSVTVKDSDGTAVTGAMVVYEILIPDQNGNLVGFDEAEGEASAAKIAQLALPLRAHKQLAIVPTLSSALGIVSPEVLCGADEAGTITVRASISKVVPPRIPPQPGDPLGTGVDTAAHERSAEVVMKVQGPPTSMTLSASPSSLVCDGTATSAVSATLTDAAGNPAVDGNVVRFDVKALGTVSPIEAKSAAGVATTTVTPLTDIARGVTANASLLLPKLVEDDEGTTAVDRNSCQQLTQIHPCPHLTQELAADDIDQALLVECSTTVPQAAPGPVPSGSAGPNISPPSTGDGGYLSGE